MKNLLNKCINWIRLDSLHILANQLFVKIAWSININPSFSGSNMSILLTLKQVSKILYHQSHN